MTTAALYVMGFVIVVAVVLLLVGWGDD